MFSSLGQERDKELGRNILDRRNSELFLSPNGILNEGYRRRNRFQLNIQDHSFLRSYKCMVYQWWELARNCVKPKGLTVPDRRTNRSRQEDYPLQNHWVLQLLQVDALNRTRCFGED